MRNLLFNAWFSRSFRCLFAIPALFPQIISFIFYDSRRRLAGE